MTYIKPLIFAVLLIAAVVLWKWCSFKPQPVSKTETTAEQQYKQLTTVDSSGTAKYRAEAAMWRTQFKALQADTTKRGELARVQAAKARQSARKFAESGKVEDCREALQDCQGENDTKAYSLKAQESMLTAYELRKLADSLEIARGDSVKQVAFAGWEEANRDLRKEQARKPLKVYGTAAFEKQAINNNMSIGATATYDRMLFSYQKGVLQNTHEVKTGWLISGKKKIRL